MFLDTSGIFCYIHRDEAQHADAMTYFHASSDKLIHNYVLSEFVALASVRRLPRAAAISFATDLIDHPDIDVVWVSEPLGTAQKQHARFTAGGMVKPSRGPVLIIRRNVPREGLAMLEPPLRESQQIVQVDLARPLTPRSVAAIDNATRQILLTLRCRQFHSDAPAQRSRGADHRSAF